MTARGGPEWDIFVAYASPDRASARALHDALVDLGLRVCFDQVSLAPGDNWYQLLPRWVRSSSIVVALLSAHSEKAHFQHSELVRAIEAVRREQARVVPVRLTSDAWIPYGLEVLQSVDMFDVAEAPALAARIAVLVPTTPAPTTSVFCPRIPPVPKHFTGRDQLLARIAASLASNLTLVVQGLGGIGKTSLTAAVAHMHDRDLVWWVRAEDSALLSADLAELAPHLGVPDADDPADTAAAVRTALETTNLSWLVIFDNAETEQSIDKWLPRRGPGTVLITSRSRDFPNADDVLAVDLFPPEVADDFLRDRVRRANPAAADEDLTEIIDRLDGLPLALEQAAAWVVRVPSRRFAQFVAALDERDPFEDRTRPRGYAATATSTWQVSIHAATAEAPLAERVHRLLGILAPEPLPTQWLLAMGDHDYFDAAGAQAIDDALAALHAYSLITIASDATLTVHRVTQSAARHTAPPEAAQAAVDALQRELPGDVDLPATWPTMARLTPHVIAAGQHASRALPSRAASLVDLLRWTAYFQYLNGATGEAASTARAAVDLASEHLPPDDPWAQAATVTLTHTLLRLGDAQEALPLIEASLAYYERVRGPDHPDTLGSRNDLAAAHHAVGDLDRAIALHEANLADSERILGADHANTLTSTNNLAEVLRAAGQLDRALALHEANHAARVQVLGPNHPDTLTSHNNVAITHYDLGHLDRAIALHEASIADSERILGPDHADTLASRRNLEAARAAKRAAEDHHT